MLVDSRYALRVTGDMDIFAQDGTGKSTLHSYARLDRVYCYVHQHYSDRITLAEVAKVACLEERYFSTFFHKKTGICFNHWLNQLRIKKAKAAITGSDASITKIAFMVGYRDLSTFEREFKRHAGVTPSAFRKNTES